tara:strand:- start:4090 stop:6957 length:2868 start_codon:yes stop_codon:yes gene_type:complete
MAHLSNTIFNKNIFKLSSFVLIMLLSILFSGSRDILAQSPPPNPPNSGDMGGVVKAECRTNKATGEITCQARVDYSNMLETTTVVPKETYEGHHPWTEGCISEKTRQEEWEAAWVNRVFQTQSRGDDKRKTTTVIFQGNKPIPPNQEFGQCKFKLFLIDSPLVQPGGEFYNADWAAQKEIEAIYEEANIKRREQDKANALAELARMDEELKRQEEDRQAEQARQSSSGGIQNIFGGGGGGGGQPNVIGSFLGGFQPPDDRDVPVGPFINLTRMITEDRYETMDCIARWISDTQGMPYEQAYERFAMNVGVMYLDDPPFLYDATTSCMHLIYAKALSGGWGESNTGSDGWAKRDQVEAMVDACVIPYLADVQDVASSFDEPFREVRDRIEDANRGERSLTYEELLAGYDCWDTYIHMANNNDFGRGYFPLSNDRLVRFIYGSGGEERIPGEACMIAALVEMGLPQQDAANNMSRMIDFILGETDEIERMPPQNALNRIIACNQDLGWLRDYRPPGQGDQNIESRLMVKITEQSFKQCVVKQMENRLQFDRQTAQGEHDMIIQGIVDFDDPTEIINRPIGKEIAYIYGDCTRDVFDDDQLENQMRPWIEQYVFWYPEELWDETHQCVNDGFDQIGNHNNADSVDPLLNAVIFSGGDPEYWSGHFDDNQYDVIVNCLHDISEMGTGAEWVKFTNYQDYDYEPEMGGNQFQDFQKQAQEFRQNVEQTSNTTSGSLSGLGVMGESRNRLVDLAHGAEDCVAASLAQEMGIDITLARTVTIDEIMWNPRRRPTKKEYSAISRCDSQMRTATQGQGGINSLMKLGLPGQPDYLATPSPSQRACMIENYSNTFGYLFKEQDPRESAETVVKEISMPMGDYKGNHQLLTDVSGIRVPSAMEMATFESCQIMDLYIFAGSRIRSLIPGISTESLPIGDLSNPTNLAIVGIIVTLGASLLGLVRGK